MDAAVEADPGDHRRRVWKNPVYQESTEHPQPLSTQGVQNAKSHLNDSIKLLMWLLKPPSRFRRSSIFRME